MRVRVFVSLAAVAVICAVAALAADVNGKWIAQVPGRDGQARDVAFTFRLDRDRLTGTMISGSGERYIENGKISGDEISFTMTMSVGGNDVKLLYKGKVTGKEIKFTRQVEGRDRVQEFTAKRAES